MQSKYDNPLQEMMKMIVSGSPKPEIISKAMELKTEITSAWSDAQQAITFLDQMINRYSPDPSYPQGFWLQQNINPMVPRPMVMSTPVALITDTGHIIEITKRLASNGVIDTKVVIAQLKAEGDTRADRDIAKSIGNVLSRNNWQRIGTGKYKLIEQKSKEEVK